MNAAKSGDLFLRLLQRLSGARQRVVARNYANGVWQQYSGSDFVAHLGRASRGWARDEGTLRLHAQERRVERPVVMCVGLSGVTSYAEWMASYGALMQGLDVFFAPEQLSGAELKLCLKTFGVVAIVCDPNLLADRYKNLGVPIYQTEARTWVPGDRGEGPEVMERVRPAAPLADFGGPAGDAEQHPGAEGAPAEPGFSTLPPEGGAARVKRGPGRRRSSAPGKPTPRGTARAGASEAPESQGSPGGRDRGVGDLLFISIGSDGYHRQVRLSLDAFMVTAQNFLLHLAAPSWFEWRSIEMVSMSHPFAHTMRLAMLLKNGVVGFMNPLSDWQSNLEVLRPTCLFVGPPELAHVAGHISKVRRRSDYRGRVAMSEGLGSVRKFLEGGRSFRLSPQVFGAVSKSIRRTSQVIVGKGFMAEATGDLKFVVHGLASAQKNHVRVLDRLGIPVVETYGKTAACGVLASNTYSEPHLNLIGSPLAHVLFRLGEESLLEYQLASPSFDDHGQWVASGDIAQMTPFGYAIVGRKLHQIRTRGGGVLSPARFEWRLTESDLIAQACIVGDNLAFLGALIVLSPEARVVFEQNPDAISDQVAAVVAEVNETLPRDGTIKKFEILSTPFLETTGEILPNGAVNRVRILETRAADIARLYGTALKKQAAEEETTPL